jgi:2-keto-4-pentenoate hydratase/2-oxohepta-3-ene-1,7-dioic acid hydratase in catechol pathway
MKTPRRDFMKMGAAAAVGAMLPYPSGAFAEEPKGPAPLRLASFAPKPDDAVRVGVLSADGRLVDVGAAAKASRIALSFDPSRMLSLIEAGAPALGQIRAVLAKTKEGVWKPADVRFFAPIPAPPRNVYAVGWNYVEHFEESRSLRDPNQTLPEHPVFFTKGTHAVNGPYDPIPYDPSVSTLIDWETELAVILGRRGKNIPEDKALDYVFGYCVLNDTTARDLQQKKHGGQWFKGKSLDGHAPMGPWIVTAAGFDWEKQHLLTRVNGVVKQDASTSQMYFKVPRLLAELSAGLTLEAGDILTTGTPPGIGHTRKPPEYLKPGDVLESEIVGIGVLRNPIRAV